MKIVNIYCNTKQIAENLYVDGKMVKVKYDKNILKYIYQFETNQSEVDIEVKQQHFLFNKLFIFMEIVFYLISIFGIFDVRKNKSNILFYYRSTFTLSEGSNNIELVHINKPIEASKQYAGYEFVDTKCDLPSNLVSNTCLVSEELIRRKKIIKRIKVGLFFFIFLLTALIISLNIFVFN